VKTFVTRKENCRSRTTSRIIEFNGQAKTSAEWAEELGMTQQTISSRLNSFRWSVEKTFTTPTKNSK